jgi:undecaprenyl diphosphate synthase
VATDFVMQSTSFHVAIIMDGNGRWATRRGLPRVAGHRAGARAVRRVVEAAPACGISTLTLYALSSDNFQRPPAEVAALLRLFAEYLERERRSLAERGVRLQVIGRRDRLPASLAAAIDRAEATTAEGRELSLRLAIDYSARHEILNALTRHRTAEGAEDAEKITNNNESLRFSSASSAVQNKSNGSSSSAAEARSPLSAWPDVDLLVRTGGEQRLSDFLLWECAYAELCFTDRLWPDVTAHDLDAAVADFRRRDRRFGRISA